MSVSQNASLRVRTHHSNELGKERITVVRSSKLFSKLLENRFTIESSHYNEPISDMWFQIYWSSNVMIIVMWCFSHTCLFCSHSRNWTTSSGRGGTRTRAAAATSGAGTVTQHHTRRAQSRPGTGKKLFNRTFYKKINHS